MENNNINKTVRIWANVCRFFLASVFIFSGFVKAIDPLGTQYKIQDYLLAFGWADVFPDFLPFLLSVLLGMFEFCLGTYLFFGIRRRITPNLLLLVMLVMTPFTFWLALDNPVADCGCFGDAVILSNWSTFWKNVVLLIAAISVKRWRKLLPPLVSVRFDWLIGLYTFLYILVMSFYCLRQLPVFDFRPYYVGANIRIGRTIPEGEKPTVYDTRFLLEKNGEVKEFTLEDYPDSTWTFVDSKTVIKEKGYEPPITNFSLTRVEDGEDVTEEILADSSYTFLLVAYQLENADDSSIDLINEAYDYSCEHGYKFYGLTASSDDEILKWMDSTGAEYPFCWADPITLKTMIRSNPGLMLLKDGVVIQKWSVNNLPDEYQLNGRLEDIPTGMIFEQSKTHRFILVLMWYILPLVLIAVVDMLWGKYTRRLKKEEN